MMTMFGAYIGFQFVGTLYLQSVLGWSPVETALAFLPGGLLVAFGAPRLGPLVDRYGTGRLILAGSVAVPDRLRAVPADRRLVLLRRACSCRRCCWSGSASALSFPAFNMQATAGIANHEQGLASGLVNTSLQVGGALGLAIATAVISANSGGATQGAGPAGRLPAGDRRGHRDLGDRAGGRADGRRPGALAPARAGARHAAAAPEPLRSARRPSRAATMGGRWRPSTRSRPM